MTITLTENAARQVQQQIEKRGSGLGLRIGITKTGCSGYSYTYDYADTLSENDHVFESHNTQVVTDADNLPLIDGCQIDFVKEGLNSSFKLTNPNADSTCGCGESFSVKDSASL